MSQERQAAGDHAADSQQQEAEETIPESSTFPRGRDPCGQRLGSRPLAGTEAGSPRITDFRLLCAASEI